MLAKKTKAARIQEPEFQRYMIPLRIVSSCSPNIEPVSMMGRKLAGKKRI